MLEMFRLGEFYSFHLISLAGIDWIIVTSPKVDPVIWLVKGPFGATETATIPASNIDPIFSG